MPPGVAFNAPPASMMADAQRIIDSMTARLKPGEQGAIIALATDKGWNAAVVHRVGTGDRFEAAAWLGKSWGEQFTGGATFKARW